MNIHKFDMHGIPTKPIKQEQQRTQTPGEGRWVKYVDSQYVEAMWLLKSTSTTTTWQQYLIFNGSFQMMKSRCSYQCRNLQPIPNQQFLFSSNKE